MSAFLDKLKQYEPLIALAVNVGLLASGVGAPFEPLAVGIEQAIKPLLDSAGTPQSVGSVTMTIYATIIGVLTTLKAVPGLPADILAQIESYLVAAQAGTAAYIQAQSGFNPANYTPVTPIV